MTNQHKHTLVVEGGAMRGIFAAGVLDEFLKQKMKLDEYLDMSLFWRICRGYKCSRLFMQATNAQLQSDHRLFMSS